MKRIDLQAAYVLHTRPYRDSSLLIELITPDNGRVSGVVRGVRSAGKAAKQKRSMMQPFVPLVVSWFGNGDLKTITNFETRGAALPLKGRQLFSAIYVNELMTRLLSHYDEQEGVYHLYCWVLEALMTQQAIDISLRQFELRLLSLLGYGVDLFNEMNTGEPITAGSAYLLEPEQGFSAVTAAAVVTKQQEHRVFHGEDLLAIGQEAFDPHIRRVAKRLCRLVLEPYLGGKPLKSRELFV
jgi:DNA repair protein RecO (recombination protein O)